MNCYLAADADYAYRLPDEQISGMERAAAALPPVRDCFFFLVGFFHLFLFFCCYWWWWCVVVAVVVGSLSKPECNVAETCCCSARLICLLL